MWTSGFNAVKHEESLGVSEHFTFRIFLFLALKMAFPTKGRLAKYTFFFRLARIRGRVPGPMSARAGQKCVCFVIIFFFCYNTSVLIIVSNSMCIHAMCTIFIYVIFFFRN